MILDPSIECFGILSIAKDPLAETRERASYDDATVFRLRLEDLEGEYVAYLIERPTVQSIL